MNRTNHRNTARFADLVKGLAAVAAIAFVLAGVPLLLINVVGMPFGSMISDLTDPLTSQSIKASAALRLGLSIIVWLAWAQVAWALVVELVAAVRGRAAAPSRVVLPGFQRSARQLVAVAMLALTVSSSPAAASLAPLGALDATIALDAGETSIQHRQSVDRPGPVAVAGPSDEVSRSAEPDVSSGHTDYEVRPGDSFWSLAEEGLGDGFRWREIRELNDGRVVGDGVTITNQTENLQPGWVLRLPADAEQNMPSVEVDHGDHFWSLAKDRLSVEWGREPTDAELTPYWAEMVAHNQDRLLPPGDPDLIHAGQEFEFPPIPPSPDEPLPPWKPPHLEAADDPPPPVPTDDPAVADEGQSLSNDSTATTIKPTPGRPIESSTVLAPTSAADDPADSSANDPADESAEGTDDATSDDRNVPIGLVVISGIGLVTAAVGGIIGRNQARRLGARRPGTSPKFDLPATADQLITETSDADALDELDTALRHLGSELAEADLALPDLAGVLIESDSIRLLIATPHNAAPAPFRVERDGMVWSTPRPVPPFDVRQAQNPYPLLVAVGYTDSAQLLIDLEYIGALGLDGGFADVVDVMGTMALQVATSPLADTIEVVCVGFGEELADLERVTVVPNLESGLTRVRARADEVSALANTSHNTGPAGRAVGVGDWTPLVVFDPLSDLSDETESLLKSITRTAGAGVSAVVTATDGAALTMELTEDRVSIPSYGVNLHRRALTLTERSALSTAVERAKNPADIVSANLIDVFSAGAPGDGPAGVAGDRSAHDHDPVMGSGSTPETEVVVRLLGPLRVEDRTGEPLQFARSATPEFIAYLTHHPEGIEVGRVLNTLWPSTTARRTWIANVHADAGRTLAAMGDGVMVTPKPGADDEYRLSGQVGSDLDQFRSLVAEAVTLPLAGAVDRLTKALVMVEGVPYTNITSRWPVSEGHWQHATVMVDEAARCVATLALDQMDDPALAEWATTKGLLASPQSVELHRLRLRAAIALDDVAPGLSRVGSKVPVEELGGGSSSAGLSPDAVFQHYQAVAMVDDHRAEGGSQLDSELVDLYESYRQARMATSARMNDTDTTEVR